MRDASARALAEGPADLAALAHRLKAKPGSLERLLDACAGLGFLRKQDGKYANHGFFLHGDSNDYMRMYTPKAKNVKQRPAVLVIYEPKS